MMKTKTYLSLLLIISISLNSFTQNAFGPQQVITTNAVGASDVYACDIDGDGDMDVLSASVNDSKIAWYKNTDGAGTFGVQQFITTNAIGANSVYACDIDGDGDMDVLSADNTKIAWYENTDGVGTFGTQQVITTNAIGATDVYACDIDGDGDMDVISADNIIGIRWYENTDGAGTFGSQQVIMFSTYYWITCIYACDIDGDGDMDVLSADWSPRSYDNIYWFENTDGAGTFGAQQIITSAFNLHPNSVYACDIDGDGDMDVLSADNTKIAWYENTDGAGTFGAQQVITSYAIGANSVYASDIDGDSDMDVLSASYYDNKIAWYENTDGAGTFGMQPIITTNANGATSVYASDIDGDGDMDVLSASALDDKIAWYKNLGAMAVYEKPIESFNVFPNPTTGVLTIQTEFTVAQIEIYNQLGQLVLSNTNKNTIDISNISQGLYFCKIKDENGNTGSRKVVKE